MSKPSKSHTTHHACDERIKQFGGKTLGCCCTGHECEEAKGATALTEKRELIERVTDILVDNGCSVTKSGVTAIATAWLEDRQAAVAEELGFLKGCSVKAIYPRGSSQTTQVTDDFVFVSLIDERLRALTKTKEDK